MTRPSQFVFSLPAKRSRHPGRWRCWPVWLSCLWLLAGTNLRGELVLTNFSAANPLKVMAVGDSITDDCSIIGAWRQYLQPLLQTNGYPFTFLGRFSSTASGTFTKVKHEGICGAVIAAPGMMTTPVHGYSGIDTYIQKTLMDGLVTNTPDLVLIFMGANDIGRGRNPYLVATNHLPALLDSIFARLPAAKIIVTKPTTLQNAAVGTPYYSSFATNVPIYNTMMQSVINARRAQGQNVSWPTCSLSLMEERCSRVITCTPTRRASTPSPKSGFSALTPSPRGQIEPSRP